MQSFFLTFTSHSVNHFNIYCLISSFCITSLFFLCNFVFPYLFIFGCAVCLLLHTGFLQLHRAVAFLAAERGFQGHGLQHLQPLGPVAVVHGLSCPTACGIFPAQALNPCPLHCQVSSQSLYQQSFLLVDFLTTHISSHRFIPETDPETWYEMQIVFLKDARI